ncbi:flagellar assembly protein FliH [uncultured Enterovirga sp.]|uniref:FliH/SctL family protein n=1 Tax=uncultured Enterovirga sp. TaxID=2026352 RepID=UPI0035CB55F1
MKVRPFSFGEDLGVPAQERRAATERAEAAERAAVEAAARDGYARGLAAGRQEAAASTEQHLAEASDRLANGIGMALAEIDRRAGDIEQDALAFFEALARRLAGEALAAQPLGPIGEAASEAFRHLRGVPHLAVRVNEDLVDGVEALLRSMARDRGYEGRIIVLGEADIPPGDARLDWADGGIVRERRHLDEAVEGILSRAAQAASI